MACAARLHVVHYRYFVYLIRPHLVTKYVKRKEYVKDKTSHIILCDSKSPIVSFHIFCLHKRISHIRLPQRGPWQDISKFHNNKRMPTVCKLFLINRSHHANMITVCAVTFCQTCISAISGTRSVESFVNYSSLRRFTAGKKCGFQ